MDVMKKFFKDLKKLFQPPKSIEPEKQTIDIDKQVEAVKKIEANEVIEVGRRIHYFSFLELELQLDRDITGMYRLVANEGENRRFSFSIRCEHKDYETLRKAFVEIIKFLNSDRRIVNLPKFDYLKGHYYGT